jgi:hypothetical protein
MVNVDVREAISKLEKEYGHLGNDKRKLAIARAINHVIAKGKTQVSREIRQTYKNILAKYVNQAIDIKKADRLTLSGRIKASGKPLPLIGFKAQTYGSISHNRSKFAKSNSGVSVQSLKGRKNIPGVFILTMPNGHKGVFVRGKYSGGQITRRKQRVKKSGNDLGITEMVGISLPKAMANKTIIQHVAQSFTTMFPQRFEHELKRISPAL